MKQHALDKSIIVLIVILIGFGIFLKVSVTSSTVQLQKDEIAKSRHYAQQIATLIEQKTNNNIEKALDNSVDLRLQLNETLQAFLTEQYRYIFLLKKVKEKQYMFLLDGSKENKEAYKNFFLAQNAAFDEVYRTQRMKIISQSEDKSTEEIWLSVVYPVVENGKTSALLVLDLSKEYAHYLKTFNSPLMQAVFLMQWFLVISLLFLIFLAYKFYNVKQALNKDKITSVYTKYYLNEFFKIHTIDQYFMMLIDIDDLEAINKKYSRSMGNTILSLFAQRLKSQLPKDAKVIRLGGSEFLTIVSKQQIEEMHTFVKNYYVQLKNEPYIVDNRHIAIGVSMVAMSTPKGVKHIDNVIRILNEKLLEIKKTGKNRLEFLNNIRLSDIRYTSMDYIIEALEKERFVCLYQPICKTDSKKIVKYEVLVRMVDKDNSDTLIPPSYFLPTVRGTTHYIKLSKIVLHEVFLVLEKYKDIELSMNLDLEDLFHPDMMKLITQQLHNHQDAARRLTFEILEESEICDFKKTNEIFSTLHQFNSKIAIDDFGKGYANYTYLSRLDIDIVKLDANFIDNLEMQPKKAKIVIESIQNLAHELGCTVVSEYVHNEAVYLMLKEIGVDFVQGYYLGKPERLEYYLN